MNLAKIIFVVAFATLICTTVYVSAVDRSITKIGRSSNRALRPIPLVEILDQDDPVLIEEGISSFKRCGHKTACPLKTGVCCPDQKTCCAERCTEDGCGLSAEHQAIAVAKMKLKMEAQLQITMEQKSKSQNEASRKRYVRLEDTRKRENELEEKRKNEETKREIDLRRKKNKAEMASLQSNITTYNQGAKP